ncbi:MAG TPA: SEC-C metal-binding domain-containing protein [Vicinamibacterales bacterium]
MAAHPGRNEPCHCGSGKKYKHCCIEKDAQAAVAARAKAAAKAPPATHDVAEPEAVKAVRPATHQPWKVHTSRGFVPRNRTPRKVGAS